MRLVFAGTPEVAATTLARLLADPGHEVVAVVSRPDAAQGRSRRLVPSPVTQLAQERGIEVLRPDHPRDPAFLARLGELAPDACPVVAYGALVPAPVLAVPRLGWLNVHYSLLPRWRGAAPVQRAIEAGDTRTGVTVFRLVPSLDAGPVYARASTPIDAQETAGDLLGRLTELGAEVLLDVLAELKAGTAQAIDQPETGLTYAPKLLPEAARIDWTEPAPAITRKVLSHNPSPIAWTTCDEERFRVLRGRPVAGGPLDPGQVQATKSAVIVGTGDGLMELLEVQPQGKRPMRAADWARGRHTAAVLR